MNVAWLWVALGGAAGACARYAALLWLGPALERSALGSYWGVFAVNVAGSFLLGLTLGLVDRGLWPEAARLGFGVGVLGAFTTFSTFSTDLDRLVQRGELGPAALYASLSVGLCLLAAGLGRTVAIWGRA
ncbi:fluoride efflux transporter FluC [Deinococcus lacus]|uniref:Fluoride-specific ion channel FluC n=1 Tax=Deinococcus lacus TaxID=392561 RepID=A0ABW1YEQ8_9DEIO